MSARGRCAECGEGHMLENARQLAAHDGPWFQHWRRQCVAAFGAILASDLDAYLEGDDRDVDDP